jgi:hypothetical protein
MPEIVELDFDIEETCCGGYVARGRMVTAAEIYDAAKETGAGDVIIRGAVLDGVLLVDRPHESAPPPSFPDLKKGDVKRHNVLKPGMRVDAYFDEVSNPRRRFVVEDEVPELLTEPAKQAREYIVLLGRGKRAEVLWRGTDSQEARTVAVQAARDNPRQEVHIADAATGRRLRLFMATDSRVFPPGGKKPVNLTIEFPVGGGEA